MNELAKKYGIPGAIALALAGSLTYLVHTVITDLSKKVADLQDEVDYLSEQVIVTCDAKPRPPKPR